MLGKLNQRERIFVMAGGAFIVVVLIFLGIKEIIDYKDEIQEEAQIISGHIQTLQGYIKEYNKVKFTVPKKSLTSDDVLPEVEKILIQNNIKEKATSLSDSKTTIEKKNFTKTTVKIKFHDIDFNSLSKFVYDIEENNDYWLKVEFMRLRKSPNKPGKYDALLRIISYFEK
jgi:hypothetical protein